MSTDTLPKNDPALAKKFFENKMAFTTGPVELERALKSGGINVIDVRAAEDFAKGHIPGARNLPKGRWDQMEALNRNKLNVVYCYSQVCHLAAAASVQFAGAGYSVMELEGGFEGWKDHELEVEK